MNEQHPDEGFTLVEVLLVILILGLLAAVVVAATDHMKAKAEDKSCLQDEYSLHIAVQSFLDAGAIEAIPATGASDAYEQTLVDANLIREVSPIHDVAADGTISPTPGGACDD